jgi:hypothetical protein
LSLLENGFGNLDLWAVDSFGNVMEILTGQGVLTLCKVLDKNDTSLLCLQMWVSVYTYKMDNDYSCYRMWDADEEDLDDAENTFSGIFADIF